MASVMCSDHAIRSGRSPNLRLPFAGELEGALADWLGEGLLRRNGGEPFALRFGLVSQPAKTPPGLSRWFPRSEATARNGRKTPRPKRC